MIEFDKFSKEDYVYWMQHYCTVNDKMLRIQLEWCKLQTKLAPVLEKQEQLRRKMEDVNRVGHLDPVGWLIYKRDLEFYQSIERSIREKHDMILKEILGDQHGNNVNRT